MLGENAVRRSAAPISSAMEWKRCLKTSSSTGSLRMLASVSRLAIRGGPALTPIASSKVQGTKAELAQENFVRFLLTFIGSNRNILRSCIAHATYWARTRDLQGESSTSSIQGGLSMATKKKATKKAAKKKKK